MKVAVCVPPPRCDCYGHLTRYADEFARAAAERAVDVDILRYGDDAFLPRLFASLADDECIVHFHAYLYDLSISACTVNADITHVAQSGRAITLATVMDHPYFTFMHDMVHNAHPLTRFIVTDPTITDEMHFINPSLESARISHMPIGAPVNFEPDLITPFANRTFDLLVPMLLVDMTGHDIETLLSNVPQPKIRKAVASAYETLLHDLSLSPFHAFSQNLKEEIGVDIFEIKQQREDLVPSFLGLVTSIDGMVRHERRHRMLKTLLRSVGDLKVGILGSPLPDLEVDSRVHFLGMQATPETVRLMADTRAMFNCHGTYPTHIHERVTVGMMNHCTVVTDVNPAIRETFSPDQFVRYGLESTATIEDLFEEYDMETVADAGAARIRSERRFSWDGYLDGLFDLTAN